MRLQHLNLATSDVTALAAFFERFFGFAPYASRGEASSSCATRRISS